MTKINPYFFLLILVVSFGCNSNQAKEMKVEEPLPFPTVLDTIGVDFIYRNDKEPVNFSAGNYHINYIGKYKDPIFASLVLFGDHYLEGAEKEDPKELNGYGKQVLAAQKYYLEYGQERNFKWIEGSNVEIRIDTSSKVVGRYPVMLTNKDSDTCFVGSLNQVPLILEAKNKEGKWHPIQDRYIVGCGTGVGHIFLPPNQIVITLAPVFRGEYKTQLRLKCGKNYSKPFDGNIKYSQFEYKK